MQIVRCGAALSRLADGPSPPGRTAMTDPAQLFAAAIAHHKAGQPEKAVRLYEQILTTAPHHHGALFNLAALHATAGRYDAASGL